MSCPLGNMSTKWPPMRVGPENAWAKEDMVISRACGWWLVVDWWDAQAMEYQRVGMRSRSQVCGILYRLQGGTEGGAKLLADGS